MKRMSQFDSVIRKAVSLIGFVVALYIFTRSKTLDLLFIRSWPLPIALVFLAVTLVILKLRYSSAGLQTRRLFVFFSLFGMAPVISYFVLGELGAVYFAMGLAGVSGLLSDHRFEDRKG